MCSWLYKSRKQVKVRFKRDKQVEYQSTGQEVVMMMSKKRPGKLEDDAIQCPGQLTLWSAWELNSPTSSRMTLSNALKEQSTVWSCIRRARSYPYGLHVYGVCSMERYPTSIFWHHIHKIKTNNARELWIAYEMQQNFHLPPIVKKLIAASVRDTPPRPIIESTTAILQKHQD